jgi:hypothetical protein
MRRIGRITLLTLLGLALASTSCGTSTEEQEVPADPVAALEVSAEDLERARAAVNAMGAVLTSTLLEELEKGGPGRAVQVCSEIAPALAAEQSSNDLAIRRVSLKARNPADRPDEYERAVLEAWTARLEEGRLPEESAETVSVDGRAVLRYMRPIMVIAPCLTCHGDPAAMTPELKKVLEENYPGDKAFGYAEGDLRGAFTVTVQID